ncbi:hypothetical protein DACRYDRAFT_73600 [Dacryopinax primogenitus]|uniref:Uncharacterized protein n=1 Tax=Dacryopinax primogenitus (strain DJM 731) TaxID=1858805 RepID=M5GCI8_DACPD|nr:uncharacterized protein DACRYDRAFT_73600 [Dacryopinax primogenitus]EJU06235.1 hypothetical protein DACRYDRAFT_73600 [Dacryopinax primogenitus]
MAANQLDPSALMSTLITLLPADEPKISNPLSAVTALLHTILSGLSFRLQSHSDAPLSPPPESNVLLSDWATHSPESHTLLYKHPRSSLTYLFKVVRLGDKALIHGRSLESPATASVELTIADYTSASFWPWEKKDGADPLVHGFISSNRVADFASLVKVGLVAKLAPGLEKEGLETSSEQQPPPQGGPSRPRQPPAPGPGPPFTHPPREPYAGPRNPLSIGADDLNPPGLPPSNPFAPGRLFDPNSGGMFVGPSHPIFGDRGVGGIGELPGPGRRWGGDGWLPEGAVPPGARFDPIGPGPNPRFPGPGGRLGGNPFGGGAGRMPPGFGGEPDNDEFPPSGMENEGNDMPPGMVGPSSATREHETDEHPA